MSFSRAHHNRFATVTKTLSRLCLLLALVGLCSCSLFRSKKGSSDGAGDGSLSETDLNAQRDARFGSGSIPTAEGSGIFKDIGFEYNSAIISDAARQNIEYNVEILKENPEVKVQLEGHCDERGTAEYNMALGAKRAQSVQEVLSSYGISRSRIDTISYGEEVPLNSGHDEQAWAQNRRVHFSAFRDLPKR